MKGHEILSSRAATVQLRFEFGDTPPPTAPRLLFDAPALFVKNPRARRYVLRLLPNGRPRVTIPRRGSRREAERFLEAQRDWVVRERERMAVRLARRPSRVWIDGHTILLHGTPFVLRRRSGIPGQTVTESTSELLVASPETDLRWIVINWLRRRAELELPGRIIGLAAVHALTVHGISIRNQRTRWGSCAPNGRISLNWRLVQVPDAVRDYVLLHELMHLKQPNHSRRFWRLVAGVCPDYQHSCRWLRDHEHLLME